VTEDDSGGIRIAQIGRFRPDSHSGVDVAIAAIVSRLPAIGVETELWRFSSRTRELRRIEHPWGPLFEIPSHPGRIRPAFLLPEASRHFVESQIQSIDVLHLHSVFTPHNLPISKLGAPFVLSPHGGYRSAVLRGRRRAVKAVWMAVLERAYIDRAAAIVVNSQAEADELRGLVSADRISVISNGVPDHLLEAPVARPSSGTCWLFVGRLDVETKGLDVLVEAYARVVRSTRSTVPDLVIAGPDHRGGRDVLSRAVREWGVENRVHLPGPVTGSVKQALFESCRTFILLSRNEGMPLALLEALALGRPVVVSPGTSLADLVAQHEAGWTVPTDVEVVVQVLSAAAEVPDDQLDLFGRNARTLARERFRWTRIVPRLAEVYDAAARTDRRRRTKRA
jgi:glycosyltransferase involved in cell wall biosynthesis